MKLKIPDDLIHACVAGDQKSQSELYQITYTKFHNYLKLRVDNQDDVDDILAMAYIRIYKGIALYRFKSTFESWCYRIIKNAISDFFHKKVIDTTSLSIYESFHHSRFGDETNNMLDHLMSYNTVLPTNDAIHTLLVEDIMNDIKSILTDKEVQVLQYTIEGYTHKDISGFLSITEGTSKWFLSTLRTKLKNSNILKKYDAHLS